MRSGMRQQSDFCCELRMSVKFLLYILEYYFEIDKIKIAKEKMGKLIMGLLRFLESDCDIVSG